MLFLSGTKWMIIGLFQDLVTIQQRHQIQNSYQLTRDGIIEPLQQWHRGTLATARWANKGHRLTGHHIQREALENLDWGAGGVDEVHVSEVDDAFQGSLK